MPLVNRTRAILRKAELGFLGVIVVTRVQTPRLKGELYEEGRFFKELKPQAKAGPLVLVRLVFRDLLAS